MPAVRPQVELSPGPDDDVSPHAGVDKAPARAAQQPVPFVKAEANLLRFPLFARRSGVPLPSVERGYHLYEDYAFVNDPAGEGRATDANAVWLADWYLGNLNALFSAPLDYGLWQRLDGRSPIASRLYEYLN